MTNKFKVGDVIKGRHSERKGIIINKDIIKSIHLYNVYWFESKIKEWYCTGNLRLLKNDK